MSKVSAMYPAKKMSDRPSSYPDPSKFFDFDGIIFQHLFLKFKKIEKQKKLAINVFGWDYKDSVIIHRLSNQPDDIKRINDVNNYKR